MTYKKVLLRERKRHTARRVLVLLLDTWVPRHPGPGGRVPCQGGYPAGGVSYLGTPHPDLAGYPPVYAPWHSGYCCKALWDMGTPPGVCPMALWVMLQSIMGYGYLPCGQKDRHVSKHYLPVVLRTRAVKMKINFTVNVAAEIRLYLQGQVAV